MFKKTIKLSAIVFSIIVAGCTTTTTNIKAHTAVQSITMFSGSPRYADLDASIQNSPIFKNAPAPHVTVLDYESHNLSRRAKYARYSNYQIRLKKTTSKLTEYRTTEKTGTNNRLYGFGIGYGGIISIAYLKKGVLAKQPNYFIRYQWTHISDVKGHLFPLKVGNRLSFHYRSLERHRRGQRAQPDSGRIIYQVTAKMNGYQSDSKRGLTTVPGAVFVIKYSKTTRRHRRLTPQNIYYFSQKLGWYVYAKYYFSNRAKVEYRVVNFRK